MQKPKIYCLCLHEHHLGNLKKLNYIPVGLGKNHFSSQWIRDNKNINISQKIHFMENILFIIGFGKMFSKKLKIILG